MSSSEPAAPKPAAPEPAAPQPAAPEPAAPQPRSQPGLIVRLARIFTTPPRDLFAGLDYCLDTGIRGLVLVFVGLLVGWWLYVPVHELLHAWGCLLTGGEVTRLEVDPLYGGAILAAWIPWVVAGSEYAGQLVGFDTHGSDGIYLATVVAPFLLTLFPAVWLSRRWGRRGFAFGWGATLPWALAPFLSLTGDAYELGSILVTQLPPWAGEATREVVRGDDVFKVAAGWSGPGLWTAGLLAVLVGVVWAFVTYGLGGWLARQLGAPTLELRPRGEGASGSS